MIEKTYNPREIEQPIYQQWEKAGYFKPSGKGQPYCIMLPPPNVTGSLHMGHGFQDAIMDALIRYHRMLGKNTLWQPGTDHAGIATQMIVERKLLAEENTRRLTMGREKFVEKIWEWKEKSGNLITKQLRRLGTSLDWERNRFTMDNDLCYAVRQVFIQLYDEGLIYRGKRLVNWDPILHTAISDLEVINEEEPGYLWYFRYPIVNSHDHLVIATTRPETMLGDTAVAVHPEDKRYQKFIGQKVRLPLTDREIPIIADDYVDPEFGTGCVKITPAHDFNDYAVGQRHQLPMINVLNYDAHMNENAPQNYQGLDRFEARKKIIEDLKALGLLEKIEDHTLKIPRGDRSKAIIEPWLTKQWFVKTKPLAKPAIDAVEKGEIKFVPENWAKTYYQWMYNIEDWCISRQLWWGHRIPAWYDNADNIYVGENEKEVRAKYHLSNDIALRQDLSVLDTWFSSALWPYSTLGWPEQTEELKTFYPTNVLVTGFDIIFFWVARMIMFGLKFTGKIPFHEVYITGLIRDQEGQKMSKSKGNVLDPIDLIDGIDLKSLIEKRTSSLMQPEMKERVIATTKKQFPNGIRPHGTDALRMTYCSLASTGRDIRFDLGRLEGYRNFCNKLWNATRYVLMQLQNIESKETIHCDINTLIKEQNTLNLPDQWILSRLQKTIEEVHIHFKNYRFDLLIQTLHEFTWHEYCDWYLELTKPILNSDNPQAKEATLNTLAIVLELLLKLLHPIIPFITEHCYQSLKTELNAQHQTIMLQPYPAHHKELVSKDAEETLEWIKQIIMGIRNIRGEMNIAHSKLISILCAKGDVNDKKRLEKHQNFLMNLAKLESVSWLADNESPPPSATTLAGKMEIFIPMADLIDVKAETARLEKEINKLNQDLELMKNKLENQNFVDRAPKAIVQQERERMMETESAIEKLTEQFDRIKK